MRYKIVFSDIDGTLLDKDRALSPATLQEIKKLKNRIPFILISARMPSAMHHLQQDLDIQEQPIICYNGGLILDQKKVLHSTTIPIPIAEDICAQNKNQVHLSLYHADEWYVPEMDEWALREENNTKVSPQIKSNSEVIQKWKKEQKGAHKIMAMGDVSGIDSIRDYLHEKYGDELHLYRSKETYLEISPKNISKFSAIEILLKDYFTEVSLEECIAFGDNYNDLEMLQKVGLGIAVENARAEAKEVAKHITAHHKEDGVAQGLRQFLKHL